MRFLLSGPRGARGRGFAQKGQSSIIGSCTIISVQSLATANKIVFACRNLLSSGSIERESGSHNGCGGVENIEKSVFNSDGSNEDP